ncbi:MAG: hypothetical protein HC911_18220, partial [Chloroflexaceae bacterium]|nr:hypothetical protein [Chloroflexaceae bacterium]
MSKQEQRASLQKQLDSLAESLRLIDERIAEIVSPTNVDLQLKKDKEALRRQIADLERQLAHLDGAHDVTIPAPVGDFTGREQELADLAAALATGTGAAITGVRGMGGIGKSQLAFAVAHRLKAQYPTQVMVTLLGSTPAPLAPATALQRLIQHFAPTAQLPDDLPSLTAIYQGCLAQHGQPVLLLADDAAEAAQTRPLLPPAGCALIVTSRHSFTLPGMRRFDLDTLDPADAEHLLLAICPRIGDAAPELARLCGYLPLALRVSASLLDADETRAVARYLTQLAAERLHHLADPDGDPNDPQASVAASFALSYAALPEAAQQTFAQAGVFAGSFDLPAALAIVELTTKDTKDTKDTKNTKSELHRLLQQLAQAAGVPFDLKSDEEKAAIEQQMSLLVRRSLLGYDPATARYTQHDLLRDYGRTRLPDPAARAAR